MTNLRTDEMVLFRILTKIDTDENKAIYSTYFVKIVPGSRPQIIVLHSYYNFVRNFHLRMSILCWTNFLLTETSQCFEISQFQMRPDKAYLAI